MMNVKKWWTIRAEFPLNHLVWPHKFVHRGTWPHSVSTVLLVLHLSYGKRNGGWMVVQIKSCDLMSNYKTKVWCCRNMHDFASFALSFLLKIISNREKTDNNRIFWKKPSFLKRMDWICLLWLLLRLQPWWNTSQCPYPGLPRLNQWPNMGSPICKIHSNPLGYPLLI